MLTCPTPAQSKYKREYDFYYCETNQSAYKYKPKPVKTFNVSESIFLILANCFD